jgi:hypothetical protein
MTGTIASPLRLFSRANCNAVALVALPCIVKIPFQEERKFGINLPYRAYLKLISHGRLHE